MKSKVTCKTLTHLEARKKGLKSHLEYPVNACAPSIISFMLLMLSWSMKTFPICTMFSEFAVGFVHSFVCFFTRSPSNKLTIMETPATDWAAALKPSDTLSVTAFPTRMVSADKRLISSPVLVLSKNAVSCCRMDLKSLSRSRLIIFWPRIVRKDWCQASWIACGNE